MAAVSLPDRRGCDGNPAYNSDTFSRFACCPSRLPRKHHRFRAGGEGDSSDRDAHQQGRGDARQRRPVPARWPHAHLQPVFAASVDRPQLTPRCCCVISIAIGGICLSPRCCVAAPWKQHDPLPLSLAYARALDSAKVAAIRESSTAWWEAFWAKSSIEIPSQPLLQVIRPIGAEGLDRRGPAGSCRLFLGPGFRLAARWNRLGETVKTRKQREKTGKKWPRYSLRSVKEGS